MMSRFAIADVSSTTALAATVQMGMLGPVQIPYGIWRAAQWSNNFAARSISAALGPTGIAIGGLWTGPYVPGSPAGSVQPGTLSTGTLIERTDGV